MEYKMNVIGIVGYPASGKGEFSRIALEKSIPVVVMGDIIRSRTEAAGLPLTDENVGKTARALRAELGMDAVAILTAEEVKKIEEKISCQKNDNINDGDGDKINNRTVVIDGIRGDAEVKYFRSVFENFTLIFIKADFAIRLERMQGRNRSDDTTTPEALAARDEREESFGLARAVDLADITLVNESDRETFEDAIQKTIQEIVQGTAQQTIRSIQ